MTRMVEELKREGWKISDQDLKCFSPYLTPGINRFGEYRLDLHRPLEACIQEAMARWKGRRSVPREWSTAKEA